MKKVAFPESDDTKMYKKYLASWIWLYVSTAIACSFLVAIVTLAGAYSLIPITLLPLIPCVQIFPHVKNTYRKYKHHKAEDMRLLLLYGDVNHRDRKWHVSNS